MGGDVHLGQSGLGRAWTQAVIDHLGNGSKAGGATTRGKNLTRPWET
jgi:hypothetical protein